jgi:hypothetical protein
MEAYMIDFDLRTATEAQPNRDPVYFNPLRKWLFDTGGVVEYQKSGCNTGHLARWPLRATSLRPPG